MSTKIQKWKQLYKINFFKPKTEHDRNEIKESIIINQEAYDLVRINLQENKRIEIDGNIYNPFTIDCITKYKVDENINIILKQQPKNIQDKVKSYMKFEKRDTTLSRLNNMIVKAKEDLNIK